MRAEIVTIGDELCRGEIVDTNSSYLAERLWDLDITTRWMTSCGDDADDITRALRLAVARADVVLCSGGLGPTEDDLTVDVVARLAGVPPVIDEPARARMEERFARGKVGVDEIQLRQVRVPAGARVLGNPAGLAPCFEQAISAGPRSDEPPARPPRSQDAPLSTAEGPRRGPRSDEPPARSEDAPLPALEDPRRGAAAPVAADLPKAIPVICLPGFPREVHAIFDQALGPRLAELREAEGEVERIARRIYRAFGRGEAQISQLCRGLLEASGVGGVGATIHYQVKFPETLVKLVVRDRDQAAADARLAVLDALIRARLAGVLYGTGEDNLITVVTKKLIAGRHTIATAESCTGGMIGELLTALPGSSAAFTGGAITYSNAEKVRQLGVREETLRAHGAVSEETVREMAAGARERFATELAVAVSGIAGPDGGTPDKPVGTVWLALASATGMITKKLSWPGGRDQVRTLAAWWALALIDDAI